MPSCCASNSPPPFPLESLHGRKEDSAQTLRLDFAGVPPHEFSLRAGQGDLRAAYVPFDRLGGMANTVVASRDWKPAFHLADFGVKLRGSIVESDSTVVSDALAEAAIAAAQGSGTERVMTYLANSLRIGAREVPYSVITATDGPLAPRGDDEIALNDWTARELAAKPGDALTLEYYVWKPEGRLDTESALFHVKQIIPLNGAAADPTFAPEYPGITESPGLRDWDPPFPVDLRRIRPQDEQYWDRYRTTPKAFVTLARGRALWGSRFGSLTSIRLSPAANSGDYAGRLLAALDPARMGVSITPVRQQALDAARGSTDFGEYFLYFSFFLVISALLLTGLFFRLGIEQRLREIGSLRALGFPAAKVRNLFLLEGALLSSAGAVLGVFLAAGYGGLILYGLRTWWVGAVGTRLLTLHVSPALLAASAAAGIATGLLAIALTLRGLRRVSARGLIAGERPAPGRARWRWIAGALFTAGALPLMGAGAEGFFGAGAMLLTGALLLQSAWLRGRAFAPVHGQLTLGFRGAAYRPGRTLLCIALIAGATFVIVSLDAFQKDSSGAAAAGFPLVAGSALPIVSRPAMDGVEFVPFRVLDGDDASCLNLYQPRNPRILAPPASFSGAPPDADPSGAVPAFADGNSLTYSLHLKVGDDYTLNGVRFRIAGALQDSVFQGGLLISEANFLRLFPGTQGFRFFLLRAAPDRIAAIEEEYADYGLDVETVESRLAAFHKVENTYLATFRALGGLGLILGTLGLAAVVMRNVLERRRELALLRAVGFRPRHLAAMVLAENLFLLAMGLLTGAVCALVAVAPAAAARGGQVPWVSVGALLLLVALAGIAASAIATAAALRSPLLAALHSE